MRQFYLSLFRLPLSTERTAYVVTNATIQLTTTDAQKACAVRWNIEQAHQELKQTTGIELPMSQRAYATEPYRVCHLGLGEAYRLSPPSQNHCLSAQTRTAR